MANKIFRLGLLAMVLVFGMMVIGCESLGDFATGYSAGYSATSDAGLVYTFYNYSSHTVSLTAGDYSGSLSPGQSGTQRLNSDINLYNIYYTPDDSVSVSVSGTSVTFRDK